MRYLETEQAREKLAVLVAVVKKEMRAEGVFILVADSKIPCIDSKAGEPCSHEHGCLILANGIDVGHVGSIIEKVTNY